MSAIPYQRHEDERETEPPEGLAPPRRARQRLFGRGGATLAAVVLAVAGFYAGVRVEKTHGSGSSTSGISLPASVPSAARSGATGRAGTGAASRSGFPAAGALGAGNASIGTVSSVNGKTIDISSSSGGIVKVKLSSATKITKNLSVSTKAIRPGDSVVIQGATSSNGTVAASELNDSGDSSTSTSSTSTGSSGSGSGVSSLFGSATAG